MASRLKVTLQALDMAVSARCIFTVDVGEEKYFPSFYLSAELDRRKLEEVTKLLGDLPGWSKFQFFTTAILQRASTIARTMPNRVADQFRLEKLRLPQTTEAERLVVQRVGQDLFRNALMDYWQGRCCVSGLAVLPLLRASHIKPWAKCQSDDERPDGFNGLLLAPHIDALFDGGWISFSDKGGLLVSEALPSAAKGQLGVSSEWTIRNLKPATYHTWHFTELASFARHLEVMDTNRVFLVPTD